MCPLHGFNDDWDLEGEMAVSQCKNRSKTALVEEENIVNTIDNEGSFIRSEIETTTSQDRHHKAHSRFHFLVLETPQLYNPYVLRILPFFLSYSLVSS